MQLHQAREYEAIVVTSDGRRVPVRVGGTSLAEVSLAGILRLIGLGLLALIAGSRQEPGGRRRERR